MVGGGEFLNDAIKSVFLRARAENDEVVSKGFDLGADEAIDAASETENKNNTSNTDGDA